jgi:hypothetical protein
VPALQISDHGTIAEVPTVHSLIADLALDRGLMASVGELVRSHFQALAGRNATLVAVAGLWAAWIGFVAVKWDWVARRYVDRLERDERLTESDAGVGWTRALSNFRLRRARARVYYTHMIDFGWLLTAILAGSVSLCALPLLIVVVTCLR